MEGDTGDVGLIPRLRRPPGGGNGSPLQYSCLDNALDRGAWLATIVGLQGAGHDLATKQQQWALKMLDSQAAFAFFPYLFPF